jgi:hypothetical protein
MYSTDEWYSGYLKPSLIILIAPYLTHSINSHSSTRAAENLCIICVQSSDLSIMYHLTWIK